MSNEKDGGRPLDPECEIDGLLWTRYGEGPFVTLVAYLPSMRFRAQQVNEFYIDEGEMISHGKSWHLWCSMEGSRIVDGKVPRVTLVGEASSLSLDDLTKEALKVHNIMLKEAQRTYADWRITAPEAEPFEEE